jgi:diguanylate cyclase (GGDEF)-like protein
MDEITSNGESQDSDKSASDALEHKNVIFAAMRVLADQNVQIAKAAVENEAHLKAKLKETRANAELDDKTGLYKPTVFEAKVRQFTKLTRREGDAARKHALILADFDKFHDLNEVLGYTEADNQCLIPTAKNINNDLRESDLAGRFGGEEIVIFLADTDQPTALKIGSRIQHEANKVKLPQLVAGRDHLGMSMGIVEFPQGADYTEIFNRADVLVKQAKDAGRNQIMLEPGALNPAPLD